MNDAGVGAETKVSAVPVEPHDHRVVPWRQVNRAGAREDRMLNEVTVSLPPLIAAYVPQISADIASRCDEAVAEVSRLDEEHGEHLSALSVLLLRAESVASSKIEYVEASMEDFARASHGLRANTAALSMVASVDALDVMIKGLGRGSQIELASILDAHRILLQDDVTEANYAGKVRDMQNWIGGSDHSPRNALYVPPPPDTVHDYLTDLLDFANRDDLPVLPQAAIAHAQFESIHPFTDGNGRIGRALINAIFRRRGLTSRVVVPLASALVARRETYFDLLAKYRDGDAGPIIAGFANSAVIAAAEARATALHVAAIPGEWEQAYSDLVGRSPRAGSAASKILQQLMDVPFFTADSVQDRIGGATSAIHAAIETLAQAQILKPLTNRKRNQVWCAAAIMDELEDLGKRIESRANAQAHIAFTPLGQAAATRMAVDKKANGQGAG